VSLENNRRYCDSESAPASFSYIKSSFFEAETFNQSGSRGNRKPREENESETVNAVAPGTPSDSAAATQAAAF
jgi:hypothetical protein